MKITPKGIGWLIFGVIVCASATEAYGIISALSTIALGFVFILIYVMKQFFKPRGLGWYILGGMLLAFCIESGANSDTLISAVIAFASLLWFYYRNREALDYMFSGMTTDEIGDFSYVDEETYPEPGAYETAEEVEEETVETDIDLTEDIPETDITVSETPEDPVKAKSSSTKPATSKPASSKTAKSKTTESKPALQTYPPEGPEEPIVEFELTEKE